MRKAHLLVTLALVCCTTYTMACTNFLFTKGATKDGSTMVTYSCRLPRFIRRIVSLARTRLACRKYARCLRVGHWQIYG